MSLVENVSVSPVPLGISSQPNAKWYHSTAQESPIPEEPMMPMMDVSALLAT